MAYCDGTCKRCEKGFVIREGNGLPLNLCPDCFAEGYDE